MRTLPVEWPTGVDVDQVIAYRFGERLRDEGLSGTFVMSVYIYLRTGVTMVVDLGSSSNADRPLETMHRVAAILSGVKGAY